MADRLRILTVEDDPAIRRGIVDALVYSGYDVSEAADGKEGMSKGTSEIYDLMLLDLLLPPPGGLEILEAVRKHRPTTPVIILTARGDENDRVQGLRLGADDYVLKPFSIRELLARIEAVLRRSPERPQALTTLAIGGGTVDLARREVRFEDSQRVELSDKETELLRYLAENASRAISREELLERVWQLNPRGLDTRTIDMHIARLREKLRDSSADPRTILTVRGKGYMFRSASSP